MVYKIWRSSECVIPQKLCSQREDHSEGIPRNAGRHNNAMGK
jgi:hypothetical protein